MKPSIAVLLVEDDEAEAVYIQKMLKQAEEARFEVRHVVTLKAALTLIDAVRPDIVLLDLSLPDYHGYDTAMEFSKHCNVPFIVLTGNDDMQMAMRTTGLGAQDYLIKGEVQAKPLERAILTSLRRDAQRSRERRRTHQSMAQVIPPDKATVAMMIPRVSNLLEAFEDMENFLRNNAPGLNEDVQALLLKHEVPSTIKELRDMIRMDDEMNRPRPRRSISDAAMEIMDSVEKKSKAPSEPPQTWEDAEKLWDTVISKGVADG